MSYTKIGDKIGRDVNIIGGGASGNDPIPNKIVDSNGDEVVFLKPTDVIFHNAATTNIDGTVIDVSQYSTLVLEVTGTATTRTLSFVAAAISGIYKAIEGYKKLTPSTATFATATTADTSSIPEIWEFDVAGLKTFKTPITNIEADKNVTVKGVKLP